MAKASEDTAFYTYNRFIALNEVGGDPARFGDSPDAFHAASAARVRRAPHGLLATATHDTKLGEDARARLYALSELPHDWFDWVDEWRRLNAAHKTMVDGRPAPSADEEYRLYQVLLAAWPPAPHFWPGQSKHIARQIIDQIFPSFTPTQATQEQESHPFAAPELFAGQRDACSDVYALGAMLYLLCTGYFPASAAQRLRSEQTRQTARATRQARRAQAAAQAAYQDPTLVSPRQLNPQISPLLEQIFLRALALKPEQRFASARDLAEALESMHLKTELPDTPAIAPPFPRAKASRTEGVI